VAHETIGTGSRSVARGDEPLDERRIRQTEATIEARTLEDERVAAILVEVVVRGVGGRGSSGSCGSRRGGGGGGNERGEGGRGGERTTALAKGRIGERLLGLLRSAHAAGVPLTGAAAGLASSGSDARGGEAGHGEAKAATASHAAATLPLVLEAALEDGGLTAAAVRRRGRGSATAGGDDGSEVARRRRVGERLIGTAALRTGTGVGLADGADGSGGGSGVDGQLERVEGGELGGGTTPARGTAASAAATAGSGSGSSATSGGGDAVGARDGGLALLLGGGVLRARLLVFLLVFLVTCLHLFLATLVGELGLGLEGGVVCLVLSCELGIGAAGWALTGGDEAAAHPDVSGSGDDGRALGGGDDALRLGLATTHGGRGATGGGSDVEWMKGGVCATEAGCKAGSKAS
jgi:hypothetical protein